MEKILIQRVSASDGFATKYTTVGVTVQTIKRLIIPSTVRINVNAASEVTPFVDSDSKSYPIARIGTRDYVVQPIKLLEKSLMDLCTLKGVTHFVVLQPKEQLTNTKIMQLDSIPDNYGLFSRDALIEQATTLGRRVELLAEIAREAVEHIGHANYPERVSEALDWINRAEAGETIKAKTTATERSNDKETKPALAKV